MLARMNFASSLAGNRVQPREAVKTAGTGKTPEAMLAYSAIRS
jgi:hypothetical protein